MGMRSHVGLSMTKELDQTIKNSKNLKALDVLQDSEERFETDDQVLYLFISVKWYKDIPDHEVAEFYDIISSHPEEFRMIEIDETGHITDEGSLNDDFNLGYRMELAYDI